MNTQNLNREGRKMKREKVVELMVHCKKMIDFNRESIELQKDREEKGKGITQAYLKGAIDAYSCIYDRLVKES
jgi:hypothetical protein